MPVPMPFAPRNCLRLVAVRCSDDVLVIDALSVGEHGRGFQRAADKIGLYSRRRFHACFALS